MDGLRKGLIGQPVAQNTHFGWIISGPVTKPGSTSHKIRVLHCSLEQELRKFWETEDLPSHQVLSPEENRCEEHFLKNHSRTKDGRYTVRLPFKSEPPIDIGASFSTAKRALASVTRRIQRSPALKKKYHAFLSEYESLGHMEKVSPSCDSDSNSQIVYLPHHAVERNSSSTTRLRVVFNASSETSNGTSLNQHLLTGQKLQTELFDILLRWRKYPYVYTADIAKTYRQIWIDRRDQDYQRILWSSHETSDIQEY